MFIYTFAVVDFKGKETKIFMTEKWKKKLLLLWTKDKKEPFPPGAAEAGTSASTTLISRTCQFLL